MQSLTQDLPFVWQISKKMAYLPGSQAGCLSQVHSSSMLRPFELFGFHQSSHLRLQAQK